MDDTPAPTGWRRLTREPALLGVEAVRAEPDFPGDWEVYVPVLARLTDTDLAAELREAVEAALLATSGVASAFEAETGVFGAVGASADGSALVLAVGAALDELADRLRVACAGPG